MPSTLFIRLQAPAIRHGEGWQLDCEWLVADAQGRRQARGIADCNELLERVAAETPMIDGAASFAEVVGLVSNQHILSLQCDVPGRRTSQLRQALPYVVEEFTAAEIEDLHIAHGTIKAGAPVACCLVAKSLLDGWLASLAEAGIRPQSLVAESELLPHELGCLSLLFDGDAVLMRSAREAATLERANLLMALATIGDKRVRPVNGSLSELERTQFDGEVEEGTGAPLDGVRQDALEYLAGRWPHRGDVINLLQGDYRSEPSARPGRAKWRGIAALAALWLLVALGTTVAEGWWSAQRADALEATALSLYQDIYPDDQSVTAQSLRRRLNARLGENAGLGGGGSNVSLIDLLGHMASVVKPSMTVASIDYNEGRGEFQAELIVRRYADADEVLEAIAGRGLEAEISSAEQVEGGVSARFRLSGL
ncbi:MAG: type II secretion system protein GspL [Gammaproteobacteria bacterium]|nr:type II secretion system protein GspL [Gammaproteobacteria bacterium]MDE0271096.1 type II secretion system protein GspL [Gammaproteobacteria bacterium]